MSLMQKILLLLKQKRVIAFQTVFILATFAIMVILSTNQIRLTVTNYLKRTSVATLNHGQAHIESLIQVPRLALISVAENVQRMLNMGYSPVAIQDYLQYMSSIVVLHPVVSNVGFYGVVEINNGSHFFSPFAIDGTLWEPPDDFDPESREWYSTSLRVGGNTQVMLTSPYEDIITGEYVISFTRNIVDENGWRIGVIALNMQVAILTDFIVTLSLCCSSHIGCYTDAIVLNRNLRILAYRDSSIIGDLFWSHINIIDDSDTAFYVLGTINDGKELTAHTVSINGERHLVFTRNVSADFDLVLGVMIPHSEYFATVIRMRILFIIIGSLLAIFLVLTLMRLEKQKNQAVEKSNHKTEFLANMSHEIRTPINAIVGMTTIGQAATSAERKDYCLARIESASQHLLGVISDVLDLSKIEANKLELSNADFNFEKMLRQVVNVCSFKADEKQQKFTMKLDSTIPTVVNGDELRLSQVITNLLSNAVKFTPEYGTIHLNVKILDTIENKNAIVLRFDVTDSGIGIAPENQKRIFDSFSQAESSTSRRYGGTGLGLSISKQIVELMGGEIGLTSKLGEGATFFFTIKVGIGNTPKAVSAESIDWQGLKILVVDDDPDLLMYFRDYSQTLGLICDISTNAERALELVRKNSGYNIYFIDWRMPFKDGLELIGELKSQGGGSVIVMISGADRSVIEPQARQAGADKFLPKPIFPSAILDVITENLGKISLDIEEKFDNNIILTGFSVLLVDDVEINREIVIALLEPTELQIDTANNGKVAVETFLRNPDKYDLILMDVQMPEMDGYTATQAIRASDIPRAKDIPILAMTANVFKEDIKRCHEAGMDDHLGKPLDYDILIQKLCIHLKVKR